MSAWPDKYVIGLTGNIATGKSVIRRMLEHLGAYGIDADALGHRAIAKGAPGYQPVVDAFGNWILNQDGQIDRNTKLASVVFSNREALSRLENIIHPLVKQGIDILVRRSKQKVIVIEAIKLLESGLSKTCDSVWVAYTPREVQINRLVNKRAMSETLARQRIAAQPPQEAKIGAANVVIRNDKSFEDTWQQVLATWRELFPAEEEAGEKKATTTPNLLFVQRAKPGSAAEIAAFITRVTNSKSMVSQEDIMSGFGEKAYLLLKQNGRLFGVVGWQVENLVARMDEIYLDKSIPFQKAIGLFIEEVERASHELLCEVALLFLTPELAREGQVWTSLGYRESSIQDLGVRAWQEAAMERLKAGSVMRYKRLREDLVLRPV
jgi:dephospho-CoA kinase